MDGGGGGERDERVVDGEESRQPSRKPVNWRVPKRRGLIPDGMVQAQLSNFVVRFPNLGVVGGCKQTGIVGDIKTASCQLELSGGKRKRGINDNIKLKDREIGGQPSKLSKLSFLPGDQTE